MLGHIHRRCFVIPDLVLFDPGWTTSLVGALLLALLLLFLYEFGRAVATKEAHLLVVRLHQHFGALLAKFGPVQDFEACHLILSFLRVSASFSV